MPANAQPQASLYETTIENAEVEAALEEWQKARDKVAAARKALKPLDERMRVLVETLELGDEAPVRVGRFVLTQKSVGPRTVSFEAGESRRLYVRPIPELA